jgi:DNA-binding transcriptional LysR family regulator
MDFYQLRYLKEIYNCKSYTKAAESLGHTPSALTIAMQKLEAELGVQLFVKKGRAIEPSEACKKLIPIIDHTLSDTDKLFAAARGVPQDNSITIRIGVPDSFPLSSVSNIRSSLAEKSINIHVEQCGQRQLMDALNSGLLDISILRKPFMLANRFTYIPYIDEEFYAYCSFNSEYAYLDYLTPDELASSFLIVNNEIEGFSDCLVDYLGEYGCKPKNLCTDTLSMRSAFALAISENGINVAPRYRFRPADLAMKSISPVFKMGMVVAWDKHKVLTPAEKDVVSKLIEAQNSIEEKRMRLDALKMVGANRVV